MKIQTRITLLFTLLCTCVIVALSFSVYYFTYQNASQDFYTRLQLRANITARAYLETNSDTAAFTIIRREQMKRLPDEREYIINIDTLQKGENKELSAQVPSYFIQSILTNGEASFRKDFDFFHGIKYSKAEKTYIIIVAAENAFLKDFLSNLQKILTTACIVGVLVVFSIGLFFLKRNFSAYQKHFPAGAKHHGNFIAQAAANKNG